MKKNMNKVLVIALAVALLAMTIVAGTLAYLMMATESVTNTFTLGNVNITLKEEAGTDLGSGVRNFGTITPGLTVAKDPVITVEEGSETCWVFVKVEQTAGAKEYVSFALTDAWEAIYNPDDSLVAVYAYKTAVTPATGGTELQVLKGDTNNADGCVTFKENVTKTEGEVKITFTGYAIQAAGFESNSDAYSKLVTAYGLPA